MKVNNGATIIRQLVTGLVFLISVSASAQSAEDTIKDEELRSIRSVSQSILKVRGQERQQVKQDSQQLKTELESIQASLKEAYELVSNPTVGSSDIVITGRPSKNRKANAAASAQAKKQQINTKLEAVIVRLEEQHKEYKTRSNQEPDRASPKAKRLARVKNRLKSLVDRLEALKGKAEAEQKQALKRMVTRLREQRLTKKRQTIEPTVKTRMMHRQRGSQ